MHYRIQPQQRKIVSHVWRISWTVSVFSFSRTTKSFTTSSRREEMEKEKRLKEIGSRVVGHLRLHLKDIRGIDSNVRDDEGFVFREELKRSVRIDLRFGTIEQSGQISNAKVGARSSSRSSNVQLEARWNDAHFDLPVRLCDFKDHTACLTITLFGGGSSSSSFREIARCKLKFLKSKSVGEQCKKMHLCDNVRISHNREKEMWIEAAKSFSVKPFSNGKDRRYVVTSITS